MAAASRRPSNADVIWLANFSLVMSKVKLDVFKRREPAAAEGAAMKSVHRSILARALITGAALLALVMMSAGGVRADTVIGADGTPGAFCYGDPSGDEFCAVSGGDGESVVAGGNPAVAIGGNGGAAGDSDFGLDGTAMAATAVRQRPSRRAVQLFRLRRQQARADTAAFLTAGLAVTPPRLARRLAVMAERHRQQTPRAARLPLVAREAAPRRRPMRWQKEAGWRQHRRQQREGTTQSTTVMAAPMQPPSQNPL